MRESLDYIKGSRNTHLVLSHYAAVKQYSSTNAWNVNNNGNVNNNNKYNGNYVVPVSDFDVINKAKEDALTSIIEAYLDCLKKKRNTDNATKYSLDSCENNYRLARDIFTGRYKIGRSICFIVDTPVKREVFAASFRDRVVHHWIALRMEPMYEAYLPDCMKSNRKGKGTGDAIREVYDNIREVSEGYTSDAWIYKFDLKGFFMSIDKRILTSKLLSFINDRYEGDDKEILMRLVRMVVTHCPQKYCIRKCPREKWEGLPPNKSLFNQDENHGIAIGNLTSQQFANFLLYDVVMFIRSLGIPKLTEYVDDFTLVHKSREFIKSAIPKIRAYLLYVLGITLHPKKNYIQHFSKGVSFVGGIIKPHRMYMSKRSYINGLRKIQWMCNHNADIIKTMETVNSYCGLSVHYYNYKFREQVANLVFAAYPKQCYFTRNYEKMVIYR